MSRNNHSDDKAELVNRIGVWTCRAILLGALIWAAGTGREGTALLCVLILIFCF